MATASNLINQNVRISSQATTSPIFRIKGQRSRWFYPDERLTPEHAEIMRNIDISERGVAHSRYGYELYSSSQVENNPVGLHEVKFRSGDTRYVVVTPTKIYNDDGTTRSNITGSDLTGDEDDRVQFTFVSNADKLLINNSKDQVRTWTGSTSSNTTDLTGMPFTKCASIAMHRNTLIASGITEGGVFKGSQLVWCQSNRQTHEIDITSWQGNHRWNIGFGDIIRSISNWNNFYSFTNLGVHVGYLHTGDIGMMSFVDSQEIRGFTPVAKHSIVARPEFICGIAKEGIFAIMPDNSYQIMNSDDTKDFFALNQSRLQHAQAFVRERDRQVRFMVKHASSGVGFDQVLVWDWETNDTWLDIPSNTMNTASTFTNSDGVIQDWFGGADGALYKGNSSAINDDNGTNYTWRIKMSPNDLGLPGRSKHILNVTTLYRKRAGQQVVTFRANINEGRDSFYQEEVRLGTGIM